MECEVVDWIKFVQDKDHWQALVNTNWESISCSRSTMLYGILTLDLCTFRDEVQFVFKPSMTGMTYTCLAT
jgi:hypothetical protein